MPTTVVKQQNFAGFSTADIPALFTSASAPDSNFDIRDDGSGNNALYMAGAFNDAAIHTISPARTVVVGVRFKLAAIPNATDRGFLSFRDGTNDQLSFYIGNNSIGIYEGAAGAVLLGSAPTTLAADTYYHLTIAARIGNAPDGTIDLYWNGVNVLSQSGIDTQDATSNNFVDTIRFYSVLVSGRHLFIDHYYISTDAGLTTPTVLGDTRMTDILLPTSDDAVMNWPPLTGVDGFAMLDDPTLSTADYVSSGTAGDQAFFGHPAIPANVQVHGVTHSLYADKDDAGAATILPSVKSGATTDVGPATALVENSPIIISREYETDPDTGAPWTEAGINAARFGFERG